MVLQLFRQLPSGLCRYFPRNSPYCNYRHLCTEVDIEVPHPSGKMELKTVVSRLNKYAPNALAESWDNVGLLIEPSPPHLVEKMLLTNDLTASVMEEALQKNTNMILSYHPPIFVPLKRLTQSSWKEKIVIQCLENRVALYSPHTSFDAVAGGVNDWLLTPFEGEATPLHEVKTQQYPTSGGHKIELSVPAEMVQSLSKEVQTLKNGLSLMNKNEFCDAKGINKEYWVLNCTDKKLPEAAALFSRYEEVYPTVQVSSLNKPPIFKHGMGRICKLKTPISLGEVVEKVKGHLKLSHVRLAAAQAQDSRIKTLAVCAGSGGTVLKGTRADLYITGEMSHHEVLEATQRGISVILCDHSNTERGFLHLLKTKLTELFDDKVDVIISETDTDPLTVV